MHHPHAAMAAQTTPAAQPDVVIVGAGPVGLWTAIQIKKRRPDFVVQMFERHTEYQRSHILRLENFSMLAYSKKTGDTAEADFMRDVLGDTLAASFKAAAGGGKVFIRTNDLEAALKTYAHKLGIGITQARVDDPHQLMAQYPDCKTFIAADGARSKMRDALLGDTAVHDFPMQYVVEIKYQAQGKTGTLDFLTDQYKTNKLLSNMVFEYVGREKNGTTPVTLRFFIDKDVYDAMPEAGFKNPLTLDDPRLPPSLAQDIQTYMNVRRDVANETYLDGSARMSKLTLSVYAAKTFGVSDNKRGWFLVGDAAMGVPYFRALNAGIIMGSQLAAIVTRPYISAAAKVRAYNVCRPLDKAWEFTGAHGKNLALKAYDAFRRMSAAVPWEMVKWDDQRAADFKTAPAQKKPKPPKPPQ